MLTDRRFSRMVLVYLFCSAMIILYVLPIHEDFWVVDDGRPVNYLDVLQPDEVVNAGVVLYSCSLLFASVAACAAMLGYWIYCKKAMARSDREGVALSVAVSEICRSYWAWLGRLLRWCLGWPKSGRTYKRKMVKFFPSFAFWRPTRVLSLSFMVSF